MKKIITLITLILFIQLSTALLIEKNNLSYFFKKINDNIFQVYKINDTYLTISDHSGPVKRHITYLHGKEDFNKILTNVTDNYLVTEDILEQTSKIKEYMLLEDFYPTGLIIGDIDFDKKIEIFLFDYLMIKNHNSKNLAIEISKNGNINIEESPKSNFVLFLIMFLSNLVHVLLTTTLLLILIFFVIIKNLFSKSSNVTNVYNKSNLMFFLIIITQFYYLWSMKTISVPF